MSHFTDKQQIVNAFNEYFIKIFINIILIGYLMSLEQMENLMSSGC